MKNKLAIVDDSVLIRSVTTRMLSEAGFEIIISVPNGKALLEKLEKATVLPDLILLDLEMPVMNGLETLVAIKEKKYDIPVVMFSSKTEEGTKVTFECLEAGAMDFVQKPDNSFLTIKKAKEQLIDKIKSYISHSNRPQKKEINKEVNNYRKFSGKKIPIIALGSSTGGVKSAGKIIPKLKKNIPPLVWAQHMPRFFTKSLAERLDGISKIKVVEAKDGDFLTAGTCFLAPGDMHMKVIRSGNFLKIKLFHDEKYVFKPSCDALFESVANIYHGNALGIILTGMGDDGAKGLKKMHAFKNYTIAQDENTCVIYGMPKAAVEANAVDVQLPDKDIAEFVNKMLNGEWKRSEQ